MLRYGGGEVRSQLDELPLAVDRIKGKYPLYLSRPREQSFYSQLGGCL